MQPQTTRLSQPDRPTTTLTALKTVIIYILVAGAWFLCIDVGLSLLVDDPARLLRWQATKDLLFIGITSLVLFLSLRHLLQRQQQTDEAYLTIQRGTAGAIGQDYFQFLTENLPKLLNTRICFVGEWDQSTSTLKTLAGYPAEFAATYPEYPLEGTPCKQILQSGQPTHMSGEALLQTPMSSMLQDNGISSYYGVPLVDAEGTPIGLLVSLSDHDAPRPSQVLDILQTFAARASSELGRLLSERRNLEHFTQLGTLFDSLNAIIYVADMESYELLYVNHFAEELFGPDWRDRPCFHYLQGGKNEVCPFCTNPSLIVDGQPGPSITWEFRNLRNQRWYQCLDKCIRWTDGRLVRLEIALDITPRKEMEETKEELLSAISHEMRTPLTAITGFAELLLDEEELPETVKQYVQTIFIESEKMADLVNTFLELRRLKANQARVDYQTLQLQSFLERATQNVRDCSDKHPVSIACPADIYVFGNEKELRQVVVQLLSNACRFSPEGGEVTVDAHRQEAEVIICFTDRGIGVPPEEHEKIFEHFHRLDRGNRRRTGGAGLGLSLVRETIKLHGGRVWVESDLNQGSRFFVALPGHTANLTEGQD